MIRSYHVHIHHSVPFALILTNQRNYW